MEYEHKAKMVADCLQSYRRDDSGWKVCKKSVIMSLSYSIMLHSVHGDALYFSTGFDLAVV